MKILLINPPIPLSYYNREFYVPSGLLCLAGALQKNTEEVELLDLKIYNKIENSNNLEEFYGFYTDILLKKIAKFRPDVIGFGCLYSGHFPDVLKFSDAIKRQFKDIPIMLGGIHATIYPFEILNNCSSIDWIILGEGEQTIIQVVNTVKNKNFEFEKINGFAFRENGKIIINPKTQFIHDLDSIPFSAYELIKLKDYYVDTSQWHNPKKLSINTSIPLVTSRSCPNRCNFCSMFMVMGPMWRARSPENVVSEIEYLYKKHDQRHFSFMDDNLTLSKAHIMGICDQIIKRKLDIHFETPNGVAMATLDEEVLDAMVSAGLTRINLAIESGSDYIRNKIMGKNLKRENIFKIINLIRKYKQLYVKAFFIIGMPEETKETLLETYEMINDIGVDRVYLHNVVPFPGTRVFEQARRDNLLVNINVENLYKSDELYLTNFKRVFIKPYELEVSDILKFRTKCEALLAGKKSQKIELQET